MTTHIVRARKGHSVLLERGATLTVRNTHGSQVVDTWALALHDPTRLLSMAHTRFANGTLTVSKGDVLYDTRREPMLRIVEDSSPGSHDTLVPACDPARYRQLGAQGWHASCDENYREAMASLGHEAPDATPQPLNLFMNVPVQDGRIQIEPPLSRPGDAVVLEALVDVHVIVSACPQDLAPTNGPAHEPTDVELVTS